MPETKKTAPKKPQDHKKPASGATISLAAETVTIDGTTYKVPNIDRLDRAGVKRLRAVMPLVEQFQNVNEENMDESLAAVDALYDIVGAIYDEIPQETIDTLLTDDLKALVQAAGLFNFTGDDAVDEVALSITLGESSASTNS